MRYGKPRRNTLIQLNKDEPPDIAFEAIEISEEDLKELRDDHQVFEAYD